MAPTHRQADNADSHRRASLAGTLESWLTRMARTTTAARPNPVAEGTISIAVLKLGFHDTVGMLVAGSERPDVSDRDRASAVAGLNQPGGDCAAGGATCQRPEAQRPRRSNER